MNITNQRQLYIWMTVSILCSLAPFLWLFTQTERMGGFLFAFANIAGFIGGVLLLWQFLLGTRGVVKLITPDYISLIKAHIFLGIYGAFFVLLHPILEMMAYMEGIWFLFGPDFSSTYATYITFGRFALILFLLIWITSAFLREKMAYRPWLYIHYLSYPLMVFMFIHAFQVGTYIFSIPFIKAYWIVLTGVFIILVFVRLARLLNFDKVRYIVKAKDTKPDAITVYTLQPKGTKTITPVPGQFIYVKPHFFGETHPFSVLEHNQETGEISFGIKSVGLFTKLLEKIPVNKIVYLEGPYGIFTREGHNMDPKVIIAGGIGIVPFYELIKRYGKGNTVMFYSNKKLEDALYREQFIETLGNQYIDAVTREKPDPGKANTVIHGRLSEDIITSFIDNEYIKRGRFFICGSTRFMSGVVRMLNNIGVPRSRMYMEEFGF